MSGRRRRPQAPPPHPEPPERPRLLDYAARSGRWLLAGGIGTVAAAVGLFFVLSPDSKPKPKTECDALGVELSNVAATGSVIRRTYLVRQGASTAGLSRERLNERGELIAFDIETKGYLNADLVVATRVVTPELAPVEGFGMENPRALILTPDRCADQGHREVWSSLPTKPGRYKIELRILDPRGNELRVQETQVFSI